MAERHVRLKAPEGITGVEYGGQVYAVENGHVLVPIMIEPRLTKADMGFTFPDEPRLIYADSSVKPMAKRR